VLDSNPLFRHDLLGHGAELGDLRTQLVNVRNQRDHDLNLWVGALFGLRAGCLEDRPYLHLRHAGHHEPNAAAPEAHHGVYFPYALHHAEHVLLFRQGCGILARDAQADDLLQQRLAAGQELVHGRIDQADDDWQAVHGLEDALEILLLEGQQLLQEPRALFIGASHDHTDHRRTALFLKEHMLGAAEADALGAKGARTPGVSRIVRIGIHAELARFICPLEELGKFLVLRNVRFERRHGPDEHLARRAINGDEVSFADHEVSLGKPAILRIDADLFAADYAGHVVPACDNGGVRGGPAMLGQHALGHEHASDVVRRGLRPHQNDGLALAGQLHGSCRVENGFAGGCARRGVQAPRDLIAARLGLSLGLWIEHRMEECIDLLGRDAVQGLMPCDEPFVGEIYGDLDGR